MKGKHYGKFLVLTFFLLCCILKFNITSNAATIKSGSFEISSKEIFSINFQTNQGGIVVIDLDVQLAKNGITSNDSFVLELEEYPIGQIFERDICKLPSGYSGVTFSNQYYCERVLPAGRYSYCFDNNSVHDLKIDYVIRTFPSIARSFNPEKQTVNMTGGKQQFLRLNPVPNNSYLGFRSIASSNSKIAEVQWERGGILISANSAGTCYINITSTSGYHSKIKVKVTNPKTPKLLYTSYKMCMGESFKNTLRFTNKKVTWTSSNKKVATVSKNGKIKAKNIGKTTITAKVGKKRYKCKVTVVRQEPNFNAALKSYNTRNNYFNVKFYNNSNKSVTIYSSGAKVMHVAYKSYDRNLKLKKNSITIKPHKSATVKFYVKGRVTWPDYLRYTLQYKFKFDGKTYTGRVWDDESIYKKSKWYCTYWDEEAYDYWL